MIKKISLIGSLFLLYIYAAYLTIVIIVRLYLKANNIIPFNFFHPNIIVNYLLLFIAIFFIIVIHKIIKKIKIHRHLNY